MNSISRLMCAGLALSMALFTGCDDKEKGLEVAEPVDLTMTLNQTAFVIGDELVIDFTAEEPANEDFDIALSATLAEGGDAAGLFEAFPAKVSFAEGETKVQASAKVSDKVTEAKTVVLKAASRGYTIKDDTQNITVADHHYITVSIENKTENTVNEGENFVLVASMEVPASQDITVIVTPKEGEEDYYENLPESIKIAKGEKSGKSAAVTMAADGGVYDADKKLGLSFTSFFAANPVKNADLVIKRIDKDEPLGALLTDERHVYADPSVSFVSAANRPAVEKWGGAKGIMEVTSEVTPHPNTDLAAAGWKFYNAMEFHFINAILANGVSIGPDDPADKLYKPHGFFDQNTSKVQTHTAVVNDKFSTVTRDGYLRMWSAKGSYQTTGEGAGQNREYGTSAFYCSKFNSNQNSWTNKPMHTRIFPGMRIECRIKVGGSIYGFNPAFWLQGNSNIDGSNTSWPNCGEIDILENPNGPGAGGNGKAWQTLHMGDGTAESDDVNAPTSGALNVDMASWNIFWVEWSADGNTITLGVNGKTNLTHTKEQAEAKGAMWPFDKKVNKNGLHLLLTFVGPNEWALGKDNFPPAGWDSGFADISYEDSKTNDKTPRMEVDWIRFYVNDGYSDDNLAHSEFKFY